MSENIPWQPPPEGVELDQGPLLLPQEVYDQLMALPPGTDVTHLFEFEPGWDLTVTTQETDMGHDELTTKAMIARGSISLTHMSPRGGVGPTPCCGRATFELPPLDRITGVPEHVTCTSRDEESGQ